MRITSNTFPDQFTTQLQGLREKEYLAQKSISSGQKIFQSSDDPTGFSQSIQIQSAQRLSQQFKNSIVQVKNRADANLANATNLQKIVSRASELAIRSNGVLSPSDLKTMASEVNDLIKESVGLGNGQQDGQFLFGGTYLQPQDTDPATGNPYQPFTTTLNANGEIATVTYRGNQTVNQVQVDTSTTMDFNLVGANTVTPGNPRGVFIDGTADVFSALINFRDQLNAGSVNQTQVLSDLHAVEDNVAIVIGSASSNLTRVNLADQTATQQLQAGEANLSRIADADIAETVVGLQRTQAALQGALQTGAHILDLTILNYIR